MGVKSLVVVSLLAVGLTLSGCKQVAAPPELAITSFGASPLQPLAGQDVTFSWELDTAGITDVTCGFLSDAGAPVQTVDCDAGSVMHVYGEAGSVQAGLTATAGDRSVNARVELEIAAADATMAVDDQLTVTYDALPAVDLAAQLLANDISVAGSLHVSAVSGEHVTLDADSGNIEIDTGDELHLAGLLSGEQQELSFGYTVSDEAGASASATVRLTILGTAELLSIEPASELLEILTGESVQPLVSFDKKGDPSLEVAWSSSDEAVATVDSEGNITGVATGVAVVTVSSLVADVSADIDVVVRKPFTMAIDTGWLAAGASFQLFIAGTGNISVDWGDGADAETYLLTAGSGIYPEHLYPLSGPYEVSVTGGLAGAQLGVPAESDPNHSTSAITGVESWGNLGFVSLSHAFDKADHLTSVPYYLPAGVTELGSMFLGATDFDGDIAGWDTAAVTDMSRMFGDTVLFDGDIGNWDTSGVKDMSEMFRNASAFNGDIGGWDTGSVTTMSAMFSYAASFNRDIGSWDTARVVNMEWMFNWASDFSQDLTGWCVQDIVAEPNLFRAGIVSTFTDDQQPHWGETVASCPAAP